MDIKSWSWKRRFSEKSGDLLTSTAPEQLPNHVVRKVSGENPAYTAKTATSPYVALKEAEAKQHAKVAEEAVAGWEKAEAEREVVKRQLEAVTREKAGLQERLAQLDGALKDCTKQVRLVREEQEQKRQELLQKKNKELEKVRVEYEAKLAEVGRQLLEAGAESKVMAMTLQEHVRTIGEVTDAKSRAEAENKVLQLRVDSVEKEKAALKYEVHVLNKQIQLQKEERDDSKRDVDSLNRQHNEDAKKITKLEAECQKLRILVRRKLPGPNALAQMKMEVEGLDVPEEGRRKHKQQQNGTNREIELLVERLLSMEEETKMLKEALAQRNGELQTSRLLCAKTATKLSAMEAYFESVSRATKPRVDPDKQSVVTASENDDEVSRADAWASALIAELSQFKKDKLNTNNMEVIESPTMEIMDDFAEMERLASDLASEKTSPTRADEEKTVKRRLEDSFENSASQEAVADDIKCKAAEAEQPLVSPLELTALVRKGIGLVEELAKAVGSREPDACKDDAVSSKLEKMGLLLDLEKPELWEFVNELVAAFEILLAKLNPMDKPQVKDSEAQTNDMPSEKVELELVRIEKLALESHMKTELNKLAAMEAELVQLRNDKLELRRGLETGSQQNEQLQAQLHEAQQFIDELQAKLCASDANKEEAMVVSEVAAQAQSTGSFMQDVVSRLEKELEEEYRNDIVEVVNPKQEEQVDEVAKPRKEQEIAEAEETLAECQRTILALGKQLKALSSPHHSAENSIDSRADSDLSLGRKHPESEADRQEIIVAESKASRGQIPDEFPQKGGRLAGLFFSREEINYDYSAEDASSLDLICASDVPNSNPTSNLNSSSPFVQKGKPKRSSFSRFFTSTKSKSNTN